MNSIEPKQTALLPPNSRYRYQKGSLERVTEEIAARIEQCLGEK